MTRVIVLAVVLALSSVAGTAALPAPIAGEAQAAHPTLKRGDRGRAVRHLQRHLRMRVDGVFGPRTARVVRRFQRRRGLTPDGVVGPATWRALHRRARARARARRARSGVGRRAHVRVLQRRLGVAADGVFGPQTARAVRRFQRRRGLTADGIVGPRTWRALGLSSRRPVLRRRGGSRRRAVRGVPADVWQVIRAANRIARKPYKYGGGHGRWNDSGYDCSGSVSYALHGAGLLRSPRASGGFTTYGRPGRGRWITIYANSGHMYMVVRGRRFDTSGLSRTGSRWQPNNRSSAGYVVRHPAGL